MIKQKNPLILLTNDDGFYADGIEALYHGLKDLGEIYIVAPDRERSATSLALTLHQPLRVKTIKKNVYAADGTPADCVYLAIQKLLPRKPDLLISGINPGPNLGQQDISYSGTVAGAIQGTFLQVPSMAISLLPDKLGECSFDFAVKTAHMLAETIIESNLPNGITLNINIPPLPVKGIKVAKLGEKRYNPEIIIKKDPRDRIYYWLGTGNPKAIGDSKSDVMIIKDGYITATPLHRDLTDHKTIELSSFQNIFSKINLGLK
ncbi:MAG: 5'/3'-nucleotidase SurE [Acidobacteriota bacterium]|nr:5'/3'-nucleotidase SurE [Acidobacteriota bacterium]